MAWSRSRNCRNDGLCATARREQPGGRAGSARRASTLAPPADSPKMVTRAGSPPKRGDVGLHPLEGGDLVEQAEVARAGEPLAGQVGQVSVAEGAEPVVERDQDAPVAGEGAPVVPRHGAGAVGEGAAVEPHEHRPAGTSSRRVSTRSTMRQSSLIGHSAKPKAASSRPAVWGACGPNSTASRARPVHAAAAPAPGTERRQGVRDPLERDDAALGFHARAHARSRFPTTATRSTVATSRLGSAVLVAARGRGQPWDHVRGAVRSGPAGEVVRWAWDGVVELGAIGPDRAAGRAASAPSARAASSASRRRRWSTSATSTSAPAR